uniref:Distal membrane arm assembly component 2 like n=1 Tax=Mandrillus leucophaeus TaxID=9568 RepID=A0A2K5YHI5_MANLE
MMLFGKVSQQLCGIKKLPWSCDSRYFWGWLNAKCGDGYGKISSQYPGQTRGQFVILVVKQILNLYFFSPVGLQHVEKIRLCKCHYIEDDCLLRLGQLENLQKSILEMEIISCGNITDKGIIALRHLRNLKYLLLSDLPGVREKENLIQVFETALPSLELKLQLK